MGSTSPNVATPRRLPRRAASRRDVPDGEGDTLGDVPLAPVGGSEGHRRRRVEQEPHVHCPFRHVRAHVRLAGPRGRVPVDPADVVAGDVRPHLGELGPVAEHPRPVVADEEAVDAPADREIELAEMPVAKRPGAGAIRSPRAPSEPADAHDAASSRTKSR
jgi:hypothetical protein